MALTAAQRQKRYRERLKENNPQKYEQIRLQHLQKVKSNCKKIGDMTEQEKEIQREKWRIANAKRQGKIINAPEGKSSCEPKKYRQRKYFELLSQNENLLKKVQNLRRQNYRYKQEIARLREKLVEYIEPTNVMQAENIDKLHNASPLTKTNNFLTESLPTVSSEEKDRVKKKILQFNTLTESFKNQYNNVKTNNERRVLKSVINCDIVKKYKMKTKLSLCLGFKGRVRKMKIKERCQKKWEEEIRNFFLRDDVSRQSAGRQEFKTYKKNKVQKRYLIDPTKKLYEKYKKEKGPTAASYSTFMRYKPFFVVKPKIQDRDTCACIRHSNISFKALKLKKLGVLKTSYLKELLAEITCSENYKCMYSKCEICKEKQPLMDCKHDQMKVQWLQWRLRPHNYEIVSKGTIEKKTSKKYTKDIIEGTLSSLIEEFVAELHKFKKHHYNIIHQGRSLRKRIDNLDDNEAIIVCDFSENYSCKFSEEIQAVHFGSSRRQITLHTSVVYKKLLKPTSICSISPINDHGPAAIWAHLDPVITYCKNELLTEVIHIYSDGPCTQYKQKHNFYLFSKIIADNNLQYGTWNYFESSHGKGPADGVGGAIKRKLDQYVAHGNDITNAEEAYEFLVENTNVKIFYVPDSEITSMKKIIPDNVIPLKGTQNVHQIISVAPGLIKYRDLSCFDCGKQERYCQHFNLKHHSLLSKANLTNTSIGETLNDINADQRLPKAGKEKEKVTILSDIKFSKENTKFYGLNNVPLNMHKIKTSFNLFSGNDLEHSDEYLTYSEKGHIDSKVIPKINPEVNINIYGYHSSDENHPNSQSSKENKMKRRRAIKSIGKENFKLLKRSKRYSSSTTTVESDIMSTYSDSDMIDTISDNTYDSDNTNCFELDEKIPNKTNTSENEVNKKKGHNEQEIDKLVLESSDMESNLEMMSTIKERKLQKTENHIDTERKYHDIEEMGQHTCEINVELEKGINELSEKGCNHKKNIQCQDIEVAVQEVDKVQGEPSVTNEVVEKDQEMEEVVQEISVINDQKKEKCQEIIEIVQEQCGTQSKETKYREKEIKLNKIEEMNMNNTISKNEKHFSFDIGDKVLVRYYQRKSWKYYTGIIENINSTNKTYSVSYYKAVKRNKTLKFTKPKRLDKDYNVPEISILKQIKLVQISESPEEYVLCCDEDVIYF